MVPLGAGVRRGGARQQLAVRRADDRARHRRARSASSRLLAVQKTAAARHGVHDWSVIGVGVFLVVAAVLQQRRPRGAVHRRGRRRAPAPRTSPASRSSRRTSPTSCAAARSPRSTRRAALPAALADDLAAVRRSLRLAHRGRARPRPHRDDRAACSYAVPACGWRCGAAGSSRWRRACSPGYLVRRRPPGAASSAAGTDDPRAARRGAAVTGRFIVLEGGDGSGKSTQVARLAERLRGARPRRWSRRSSPARPPLGRAHPGARARRPATSRRRPRSPRRC